VSKLRNDTDPLIGGRDGDQLPFTPRYAVSVNGDYDWNIGGKATAFLGASLRFLGNQAGPYSPEYVAATGRQYRMPSYEVVDLRAGIEMGRYTIEAYAKNLANAEGLTNVGGEGNYPGGAVGTGVIRPRTIGLTFGAGF
jgi:iron complex outermembrane receptor protein